ncbi:hypothetical protein [Phytohabitans rumicis]|uniref:Uncharacterized protein n=1 Tax=Phytohabitans rumicis TaxID=1076125 RepID=A0A6V8L8L4_9ACTN|nr:hypothetical protein [Phytohabitans rumicis]GFJ90446.1 hypothetical protein Prum_040880 [Phytohabitans rumicis]
MANTKRTAKLWKVFGLLGAVVVLVVGLLLIDPPSEGDDSTEIPVPSAEMAQETSRKLAAATAAQGVCYGWQLADFGTPISEGSNLGPTTPIDPAQCPQWVEVQASVTYWSSSSEMADYASVTVTSSGGGLSTSTLDRFGLTEKMFIDEPDWAICQAALALPLLMAESGAAKAVPTPAITGTTAALPAAGNDFWRDRYSFVVGTAMLVALALIFFLIGWFDRRHQRATVQQ